MWHRKVHSCNKSGRYDEDGYSRKWVWHEEVGVARGGVEEIHMHVRQRTHLREVSKPCDVNDVNTFKGSKGTESKEYVKSINVSSNVT